MKASHKSAILITGLILILVTSIRVESEIRIDEADRATDMALSDALLGHQPIENIRQIIIQHPELLTVKLYNGEGYIPLEYAARRLLLQECIALTSIHPKVYSADFLLHLCHVLTLQSHYSPDDPQHTYECLKVLYNTIPSDVDLDTYQLHVRAATTDFFRDVDINELLP